MNLTPADDFEVRLRAGTYELLAALLAQAPEPAVLEQLRAIETTTEPHDPMAAAWLALKQAAEQSRPEVLDDDFHRLFIGLGRGELVPYGSWYLTGFLMEKTLGALRRDLAALGYEREEDVREPEDHAAALCQVMALLIQDPEISFDHQRRFFDAHIGSWMGRFFDDMHAAPGSDFYQAVGRLGRAFIDLEGRYLGMSV